MPDRVLRYRRIWLALGYGLVLFVVYQSLSPSPVQGPAFPFQDKVFHALAYGVLMGWFAQLYHRPAQRWRIACRLVVMGLVLEGLQSFEPARYAEFGDFLANTSGVLAGFVLTRGGLQNLLLCFERRWLCAPSE